MAHNENWDDLHYLLAVADNGSLSGAARQLGVNHATVLRRISAFEKRHRVKLFDRRKNGYLPTSDCQTLLSRLQQLESNVSELENAIKNLGNPFSGRVRVTSTGTICQYFLPRHLARLNLLHPKLEVELLSTNVRLDLAKLDAEITIRPARQLPDDLVGTKACDLVLKIYGAPEYIAKNPSGDKSRHRWLGGSDALDRSPSRNWELEANISNVVFRSDTYISLCQAAELGMGLAMLPCIIGDASNKLIRAGQFDDRLTTHVWVACHRDRAGSARIDALLDFFHDAIVQEKDAFEGCRARL